MLSGPSRDVNRQRTGRVSMANAARRPGTTAFRRHPCVRSNGREPFAARPGWSATRQASGASAPPGSGGSALEGAIDAHVDQVRTPRSQASLEGRPDLARLLELGRNPLGTRQPDIVEGGLTRSMATYRSSTAANPVRARV